MYTLAGGAAVEPPRGNSLDAGRKADLQLWRKQYRKYSKQEKKALGPISMQKRRQGGDGTSRTDKTVFVTNTTVSKWERDLSYLDIALATDIYRELSILEHEFFSLR